jgi:hypothetical protein
MAAQSSVKRLAILAGFLFLIPACAATPVEHFDPCVVSLEPADDDPMLHTSAGLMLVDGRPLVIPFERRGGAQCDLQILQISPGQRTVHVSVQTQGFSPYVRVGYSAVRCSFDAESGHRYSLQPRCLLTDLDTDEHVPSQQGRSMKNNYLEVVRAYAACGDPRGQAEFSRFQDRGEFQQPPDYWILGECDAWIDSR